MTESVVPTKHSLSALNQYGLSPSVSRTSRDEEEVGIILSSFAKNDINWMTSRLAVENIPKPRSQLFCANDSICVSPANKIPNKRKTACLETETNRPNQMIQREEKSEAEKKLRRETKTAGMVHAASLCRVVHPSHKTEVLFSMSPKPESCCRMVNEKTETSEEKLMMHRYLVDERQRVSSAKEAVFDDVRMYLGDRPDVCLTAGCGFLFEHQCELDQHEKKHSKIRPFGCGEPGCRSTFESRGEVTLHAIIHSGSRQFTCDVPGCCASFSRSSNLRRHKQTHNGAKPFSCNYCGRGFTRRNALGYHQQSMICGAGTLDAAPIRVKRSRGE